MTPTALPLRLAALHRGCSPGDVVVIDPEPLTRCGPATAADLVMGAGFAPAPGRDPASGVLVRRRTLPDTVGAGMRLLVCGLNPSLVAADAGYGYAGPSNRFWPAAAAAGLVSRPRRPLEMLEADGVGMTDLVKRATRGAGALTADEYRAGAARVERLVHWLRPRAVVFVGLAGWRAAVDRTAGTGWQPVGLGDTPTYVMPSTSGRNAHARLDDLAEHLRRAAAGGPGTDRARAVAPHR